MKTLHLTLLILPALSVVLACGSTNENASSDGSSEAGAEAQLQGDAGAHANAGGGGTGSNHDSADRQGAAGTAGQSGAAGAGGGAGGATGGSGGQAHAGNGGQNTGGASQSNNPVCQKPAGPDVLVQDYTLPTGCFFRPQYGDTGFTISDEAAFKELLGCEADVSSGIDFGSKRLRVAIYPGGDAGLRTFAVESSDSILVGLSVAPWCGGASPPNQVTLSLLPVGPKLISESLCTVNCNFGGGGYPP